MEKEQVHAASSPPLSSSGTTGYESFVDSHILEALLVISWVLFIWEFYLTLRQRGYMLKRPQPPKSLDNILTPEIYEKSRVYALDKANFGIVEDLFGNVLNTVFLLYWGFYYVWKWGQDVVELCGLDTRSELYITAGALTVMRVYMTILDIPFSVYRTFVLEAKHNFNNQTAWFFVKDSLLKFVVSHVLMVPLTCAMVWIVKNGGDYFFLYLWGFTVVISLLLMIIYPEFIAPLFDKYSPLPEGELRKRIEALASSIGFPLYKLYVVEGSTRSSHSNAYLYGFHKSKRIVLFDTLIAEFQRKKGQEEKEKAESEETKEAENATEETGVEEKKAKDNDEKAAETKEIRGCETDEIIAVLAHELGHWHHSHALLRFLQGQVIVLCNFYLFAQLLYYAPIYDTFGFHDSRPVLIGLLVIMSYILAPLNKLLQWLLTIESRRCEFQADRFAVSLGHTEQLKSALIKLHKDNLGYPLYDHLYSNWHLSHPALLERLDALKKDD